VATQQQSWSTGNESKQGKVEATLQVVPILSRLGEPSP
jgi:hypothetical protein